MVKKNKNNKARNYKRTTIRRLDMSSGLECAAPDCKNLLIAKDEKSIISKICHIEAANEGGPRYNSKMTDDERRAYENLILLCDACHTIIDNKENEEDYPVDLLKKWKKEHEKKVLSRTESYNELKKYPSAIATVINCIGASNLFNSKDNRNTNSYNLDDKITHNNLIDNKSIINEYKNYQGKIQKLYTEIESEGSLKRSILLQNIKTIYIKVKNKYITNKNIEILEIRKNADFIFDDVKNELWKIIENSKNIKEDIPLEAIDTGLLIVMVDAFIECKILEEPKKKINYVVK